MHATMTHYVADVPGFMAGPTNRNSPRHPSWMTATTTTSSSSSSGRSDTKNHDDDALLFSMSETAETGDLLLLNKIECEGGGTSRKATPLLLPIPTASSRSMMNRRREIISQLIHQHPSSFRSMIPDISSESNSHCQSDIHPAQARVESSHRTCATSSIGANFTVEASMSREEEVELEAQETNHEILLQDSIDDTATMICSKHDEDELEEVSLDPKWAEALRAISIRLASEKAEYQSLETAEWDTLVHSDSPVDVTESLSEKRDKGCLLNRSTPSIPILTDLQRTIEQATKSIGKFSLNAGSNDDDGDNMSLSSFASDAHLVTKNFAEYKKRMPPQHRSLRDDPAPWSQGLEFYPKQMYFGAANNAVARHHHHHHHEELNNDVLSVTSSLTCESYNSLVAPSTSSRVTTSLSKVLPHTERSCDMVNPVEMDVAAPILEASQISHSNTDLGPSSMIDCMNDTRKNAKKSVTRRSSTKKQNTHLESVKVLEVAEESDIGRENARSMSPAEDDMFEAPRKSLLSFLAALGQHSRSRSCSRSRKKSHHERSKSRTRSDSQSRSKSHGVSKSLRRSKSRTRNHEKEEYEPTFEPWTTKSDQDEQQKHNEQKSCTLPESELPNEVEQRTEEPISQTLGHQDVAPNTQEPQTPLPIIATLEQPGERCPIAHPHYKLGDSACDEDMLVFPTSRQRRRRRGRARRREPNIDSAETLQSTSSCSESNDREGGGSRANECSVDIQQAIGQLRHLDAAFIRRSDGSWTYALVADGNEDEIRFVVNDQGCTKVVPKSLWMSHVRRIRVLTQRQGDRIAVRGQLNREMQMNGKTQSCRGREKGRLVSPSPTRWKSCDLKLPTTIAE